MRTIKFRAWHHDLKKMLYPRLIIDSMPYARDSQQEHVYINLTDPVTKETQKHPLPDSMTWEGLYYVRGSLQNVEFQQFTGLLDQNNKEIYEGDIILFETSYMEMMTSGGENDIDKVIFKDSSFMLESGDTLCDLIEKDNIINAKIIGNIFENKDLI